MSIETCSLSITLGGRGSTENFVCSHVALVFDNFVERMRGYYCDNLKYVQNEDMRCKHVEGESEKISKLVQTLSRGLLR
jgi:hypothetical protein